MVIHGHLDRRKLRRAFDPGLHIGRNANVHVLPARQWARDKSNPPGSAQSEWNKRSVICSASIYSLAFSETCVLHRSRRQPVFHPAATLPLVDFSRFICVQMPIVAQKLKSRRFDAWGQSRARFATVSRDRRDLPVLMGKVFTSLMGETRHNPPSPFTIHQGLHPNPALLGNDETWRLIPDQDEGIA